MLLFECHKRQTFYMQVYSRLQTPAAINSIKWHQTKFKYKPYPNRSGPHLLCMDLIRSNTVWEFSRFTLDIK